MSEHTCEKGHVAVAAKVPFECGRSCDHGDSPHLYLNAIDPDRCAACAAWPSLPCAQHLRTRRPDQRS